MRKCPYAKPSLIGVKCELLGKIVDPRKYKCLTGDYVKCEIYRGAGSSEKEIKRVEKTRGVTCTNCLFYSELTGRCVKLKVKVEDPTKSPCKGKEFKKAS